MQASLLATTCSAILAPASAFSALLVADADPSGGWFPEIAKLGFGGVIVFVVTKPLLAYVLKRLDRQGEQSDRQLELLEKSVANSSAMAESFTSMVREEREAHAAILHTQSEIADALTRIHGLIGSTPAAIGGRLPGP